MNTQITQYFRIHQYLTSDPTHQQFQQRLQSSPIKTNRYYLGLLLMAIVSMPIPKIQYIRTLIKFGADINFTQPSPPSSRQQNGKSVLMIACEKSISVNVNYLLTYQNLQVGHQDYFGENALHYALRNNDENQAILMFQAILKQFPHLLTTPSSPNKYFLFSTIDANKPQILQFLLKHYIDSNQQSQPLGLTALHYTITLNGQISQKILQDMITILLKHNANPNIKNYFNEDCFDYSDKYLFNLQNIISINNQLGQTHCIQINNNKCLTNNTYADSKTVFSKDQQNSLQQDIDENKIQCQKQQSTPNTINSPQIQLSYENKQENSIQQQMKYILEQLKKNNKFKDKQTDKIIYYQQPQIQQHYQQLQSQQQQQQQYHQQTIQSMHQNISKQIQQYYQHCKQEYQLARKDLQQLWNFLLFVGEQLQLTLDMIGSFATGLWTHHSDIDLVFINQKTGYINIAYLLGKIYQNLQDYNSKLHITELHLNLQSSFPNIKLKLSESLNHRRIEIAIFQRKCSGRKYVQFITQKITTNPQIIPIFFLFHKILQTFDLHKPTKKGIKTYTIFLMIINSLPQISNKTLSQLFITFIYYYNHYYQYQYIIDQTNKLKPTLTIIDPLNPQNNTGGRQTDIDKLIVVFQTIQCVLLQKLSQKNSNQFVQYLFDMHSMFQ